MQQERWRRIDELFHIAVQLDGHRRVAYLDQTCSEDHDLRFELDSLLAHYTEAQSFLETPALDIVARRIGPEVDSSLTDGLASGGLSLEGAVVSHYLVIRKIGSGGMGVVYEGEDLRLKRRVALKFLPERLTRNRQAVERFEAEARAASSLNHPNICTIYEVEEYNAQPAIVMELLEGQNLRQRIAAGLASNAELIELGVQAATALAAAHQRGIVHRDIKPANMFLATDGRLKLLDFGIAKLMHAPDVPENSTRTRDVPGTLIYMSPEQIRGEDLDRRSDLFSLGLVLYELATGLRPFTRSNSVLTIEALLYETAPAPSSLNPALSSGMDRVITRLLEKDPDLRYQEASEIVTDLQRLSRKSAWTTRQRWRLAAALTITVLASGSGAMLYRASQTPVLTGKDTVVLADFVNNTRDPLFDGTLRRGLSVELQQSPYLSLVPDERIAQTLRLMNQPAEARLTPELAQGVCQRLASAAVIEGAISSRGNQYELDFRAKACGSGKLLHREQLQFAKKEQVLPELSKIAATFRAHAGESMASLREHDAPLAEATTPSLEALKAYSTAWTMASRVGPAEVIPLLRRAIALDGQFAMAHALLARSYGDIWEGELSERSIRRAYELRERTTDPERFFITVNYHTQATRNSEEALAAAELWARTYERDVRPHAFLSWLYQIFARYQKSADAAYRAIALDPDFPPAHMNLAWAYIFLEQRDKGSAVLEDAARRKLYTPEMLVAQYYIAFLNGDTSAMVRLKAQTEGKLGGDDWMEHERATIAAYYGRVHEADRLSANAIQLALHANERERAGVYAAAAAVRYGLFGDQNAAKHQAKAALLLSTGRDVKWGSALALALAGDLPAARNLENDLEKLYPEDTAVRFTFLPILRAVAALHHRQPAEAIELLRVSAPFDLTISGSWSGFFGNMYPVYFRGLAYLAEGQNPQASAEFQKILDHPGIMFADPVAALARLQLGRANAKAGEPARAKAAYAQFLELWKNGDPTLNIRRQATQEFSKLM